MRIKPEIRFHWKEDYLMMSGKIITIEMKLIRLPTINKKEYPNDYKFSWNAFSRNNPDEKIRFDNHEHKEPHWHDNGQEVFFKWLSLEQALALFYQKVSEKFGDFKKLSYKYY
jgi:hypothetical protein